MHIVSGLKLIYFLHDIVENWHDSFTSSQGLLFYLDFLTTEVMGIS